MIMKIANGIYETPGRLKAVSSLGSTPTLA